jgi:hypothetical protein
MTRSSSFFFHIKFLIIQYIVWKQKKFSVIIFWYASIVYSIKIPIIKFWYYINIIITICHSFTMEITIFFILLQIYFNKFSNFLLPLIKYTASNYWNRFEVWFFKNWQNSLAKRPISTNTQLHMDITVW